MMTRRLPLTFTVTFEMVEMALITASQGHQLESTRYLVANHKADVNCVIHFPGVPPFTPLSVTTVESRDAVETIQLILDFGADLHAHQNIFFFRTPVWIPVHWDTDENWYRLRLLEGPSLAVFDNDISSWRALDGSDYTLTLGQPLLNDGRTTNELAESYLSPTVADEPVGTGPHTIIKGRRPFSDIRIFVFLWTSSRCEQWAPHKMRREVGPMAA
ncbi:hypothetical protein BC832DRAFT_425422 [Gaertneriomyces semiglobifer]|nr:hypothetical protein BC832DRAFT_425422 [Gaertneriomyces semiglobifer]